MGYDIIITNKKATDINIILNSNNIFSTCRYDNLTTYKEHRT